MKQPMKTTRAAATGASEARQHAKGTSRKEPSFTGFENEEVGCSDRYRQPNQQGSQTFIHDLIEPHEMAKLTRERLT